MAPDNLVVTSCNSHASVVQKLLWCRHTHPKLPFPLLGLQLQRFNCIAQPVLSLLQLLESELLLSAHGLSAAAVSLCSSTARPGTSGPGAVASKSAIVQVTFGYKRLLAPLELV